MAMIGDHLNCLHTGPVSVGDTEWSDSTALVPVKGSFDIDGEPVRIEEFEVYDDMRRREKRIRFTLAVDESFGMDRAPGEPVVILAKKTMEAAQQFQWIPKRKILT